MLQIKSEYSSRAHVGEVYLEKLNITLKYATDAERITYGVYI